jgi:putative ABC transport system ATP-binding protein
LDSVTGSAILDLLFSFQGSAGMTIVLATHDPEIARRCDRLIRLRDGAVVADGPTHPGAEVADPRSAVP